MAEHGETPLREDTYGGFINLVKYGTIVSVIVTVAVVVMIAS